MDFTTSSDRQFLDVLTTLLQQCGFNHKPKIDSDYNPLFPHESCFVLVHIYAISKNVEGGFDVEQSVWDYGSRDEPPMSDIVTVETGLENVYEVAECILKANLTDRIDAVFSTVAEGQHDLRCGRKHPRTED